MSSPRKIFSSFLRQSKPALGFNPDASASSPSLPRIRAAHALLVVSGAFRRKRVARRLVVLYCGLSTGEVLLLHSRLRSPDPIAANLIFRSLVRRRSDPSVPVAFFCRHAHPVGCRPEQGTFPLLITAAKRMESIHQGEIFHCLALKLGFLSHLSVSNSLIHMYASCDGLDLARQLFDEMPVKDRISYNSLVDGYVQSCDFNEAERLFRSIPDPNVVSWSTLLNGYARNRMSRRAIQLFHQMLELGIEPDGTSVVSLLSIYSRSKLAQHGKSIHGFLVRRWLWLPTHVSSALVDFYCKCELLDAADRVFKRIKHRDLICWNTMISGFGRHGRGKEALDFFKMMLRQDMKPNDITFTCILVACAHSGMVEEALEHFKMMSSEFGIKPTFAHYWCLVDLYVRAQSPHDALKVIQNIPFDDWSSIWGAVIWLAKVHGDISVGEYLGRHLIELEPENSRRYVPLANVYAAASSWDKYKKLQELMKARGIHKLPDSTLIDLNTVVHKFSVGDKTQPKIDMVYEALQEIADQLKLQFPRTEDATFGAI